MERKIPKFRIAVLIVLVLIFCTVCMARLYDLQIVNGEAYYEESTSSIVTTSKIEAARGSILDRNGTVLVSSRAGYNIVLDLNRLGSNAGETVAAIVRLAAEHGVSFTDSMPVTDYPFEYVSDMSETAESRLSTFIQKSGLAKETDAETLVLYLRSKYSFPPNLTDAELRAVAGLFYDMEWSLLNGSNLVLMEDAELSFIILIRSQGYDGVNIEVVPVREYHTQYAAHILGHIGRLQSEEEIEYYTSIGYDMDDLIGRDGVEAAFESYLHGTDGERVTTSNQNGEITSVLDTSEPVSGDNVVLTIDIGLQGAAEDALEKLITELRETMPVGGGGDVEGGAAVVVDVNSGEVLALASNPTYDISTYAENFAELSTAEFSPLYNRATCGLYEPGSTFKPVTATAALETGTITADTTINDTGVYKYFSGYHPVCWLYSQSGHGHGVINVTKAIEVSCNYFFYEAGRLTGIDSISQYAVKFGLGQLTGLEIQEYEGTVDSKEYRESIDEVWNPGDVLQAAIGQGRNRFTPVQLAGYVSTLCNGGTRYRLTLLREIKSSDYSIVRLTNTPEKLSEINISDSTLSAVLQGMYQAARYGTPSVVFGDYPIDIGAKTGTAQVISGKSNNGIFICFAPYDEPEIAVAVVVEKGYSGANVARVAKDILDYYFSSCSADSDILPENALVK